MDTIDFKWRKTTEELPEDEEFVYAYPQKQILMWNEHYGCWDDSEGDDYYCDKESVTHWFRLPKRPKED